ncbi:hypothetical protein FS749_013181 [Ceratobasidium sp. UAMH 11750]|nr:hypothetical protein FS749_013181 [Ceratobasidium sp. UAMH 11750]
MLLAGPVLHRPHATLPQLRHRIAHNVRLWAQIVPLVTSHPYCPSRIQANPTFNWSSVGSPTPSLSELRAAAPSRIGHRFTANSPAPSTFGRRSAISSPAPFLVNYENHSNVTQSYQVSTSSSTAPSTIVATTPTCTSTPLFPALNDTSATAPLFPALNAPSTMPPAPRPAHARAYASALTAAPPVPASVFTTPVIAPTPTSMPSSVSALIPAQTTAATPAATLAPSTATILPTGRDSPDASMSATALEATPVSQPIPVAASTHTPPHTSLPTADSDVIQIASPSATPAPSVVASPIPVPVAPPLPAHNQFYASTPNSAPNFTPAAASPMSISNTPPPLAPAPTVPPTSSKPAFTWPTASTATQSSYPTEGDMEEDEVDREIALAYGFNLGDTGFQSIGRAAEVTDDSESSELPLQTIPDGPSSSKGKAWATGSGSRKKKSQPGTKWTGGPGGVLKIHARSDVDENVHRWTYSEQGPSSANEEGRFEGDVHFSPIQQFLPDDTPFKSWVCVLSAPRVLSWVEWQAGHPHPNGALLKGYVFKPAQLPRTPPRWVKETSYKSTQLMPIRE